MQNHSPLRYPGGKGQMAKSIAAIFDRRGLQDYYYVEPFAGGAAVALELLYTERASRVWINDLDLKIFAFWKYVLEDPKEFIRRIEACSLDIEEWYAHRAVLLNQRSSLKDIGFAAFYLNRTSFSGIIGSGPIGGYGQNGSYSLGARFDRANLSAKISRIQKYKSRITLTNWDARRVLRFANNFNNAALYVDPPYVKQGNRLYFSNLQEEDHIKIGSMLQNMNVPWVLTYDNDPLVEKIYKDFNPRLQEIRYTMSVKRSENELIVTNIQAS